MKKPIPFGKYYLLERINVGGMAEVFRAKAYGVEGFERLLAVKRILPNIAEDAEFITMFIDEAKIAVQLNHANIAQIFDLGVVDGSYFIALEHVFGRDLRAIFERSRQKGEPMPVAQACFAIMKMCEGLDYAHNKRDAQGREMNLVHRDVSPQNVIVSFEGEVKIIDFGIAKAAGKVGKTQAGILKGKFGYMSPEQVRGLPIDRRSDIFSTGIVLYELLTNERLFVGESDFSTLEKVRNVEILPPSTYNRKIPDELERIVLKALAKDVDDRYQNAIDLHDELQAFVYTAGEFYSRKDLAAWMKKTFAREIEEETGKLEQYRQLPSPEAPTNARTPLPDRARTSAEAPAAKPRRITQQVGAVVPPPPPPQALGGNGRAAALARASRSNPPPPVPGAPPRRPRSAEDDLDWEDEERETQIYGDAADAATTGEEEVSIDVPIDPPIALAAAAPEHLQGSVPSLSLRKSAATPIPPMPAMPPPLVLPPDGTPQDGPASPFDTGAGLAAPSLMTGGPPPPPLSPATTMRGFATPAPFPAPVPPPPPVNGGAIGSVPSIESAFPPPPKASEPSALVAIANRYQPIVEPLSPVAAPLPLSAGGGPNKMVWVIMAALLVVGGAVGLGVWLKNRKSGETAQTEPAPADPGGGVAAKGDSRAPAGTGAGGPGDAKDPRAGTDPGGASANAGTGPAAGTGTPATSAVDAAPAVTAPPVNVQPVDPNTGFVVTTDPVGAKLKLDGNPVPIGVAPLKVSRIAAGKHVLEVEPPPGFKARTEEVVVEQGRMAEVSIRLEAVEITAKFNSEPPGAKVTLISDSQRIPVGPTPTEYRLDPRKRYEVVFEKDGYVTATKPVEIGKDPELLLAVVLERAQLAGTGNPRVRPPRDPPPRDPPDEPDTGGSTLDIGAKPQCKIFLDGREIGTTPQRGIEVTSGTHTIVFMNNEYGIKESRTIKVRPGETRKVIGDFTDRIPE